MKTPKLSEADAHKAAAKRDPVKAGRYDGTLEAVTEQRSNAGNDMFVVKTAIPVGDTVMVLIDYLANVERAQLRIRHLAAACGAELLARYDSGTLLAEDFRIGTPLCVHVGIEKARKHYPARNVVEDYSPATDAPVIRLREVG